jgi:hypothetical protein
MEFANIKEYVLNVNNAEVLLGVNMETNVLFVQKMEKSAVVIYANMERGKYDVLIAVGQSYVNTRYSACLANSVQNIGAKDADCSLS